MKDWAGVGDAYSASYADLCAGTFPPLRATAGQACGRRLLDVGSGDGTLASAWAREGWRVVACEPEASMRLTSQRRHPFLPVVDGRLPDLPFADASFDVVVANFVLNHVRSPRSSAGELGRLASELVVATTWTVSPSWFWALVVARAGLEPHAGERLPADEDFERTADGFRGMLADAGLNGVTVSEHTWVWRPTARMLWASVEGGVAGAGAHYATLDASERQRFRAAFDAVVEEKRIGGVVPLEHRAAIAVARA